VGLGLYPRVGLPVPADSEPPSSPSVRALVLLVSTMAGTLAKEVAPGGVAAAVLEQSSRAGRPALPKNLIPRLPVQVRLTGEVPVLEQSRAVVPEGRHSPKT
jgi:hypothetical protein